MEKEVRWTKRCRDKALVGTIKKVISQVSHSKKWAFPPLLDSHGNPVLNATGKPKRICSYSVLQDRFFEHMRDAGYTGFERGVKGSTDEHLPVIDYKIKQDTERLANLSNQITEQETTLGTVKQELAVVKPIKASFDEISTIGKKKRLSDKVEMSSDDYDKLQNLAKEGLTAQMNTAVQNRRISELNRRIWALQTELDNLYEKTKDFFTAMRLAPERVDALFTDIADRRREAQRQKQSKRGGQGAR